MLDAILGSHSDMTSTGELINVASQGWINNEFCACGQPVNSCRFWQAMRDKWTQYADLQNIEEYIYLQKMGVS